VNSARGVIRGERACWWFVRPACEAPICEDGEQHRQPSTPTKEQSCFQGYAGRKVFEIHWLKADTFETVAYNPGDWQDALSALLEPSGPSTG